MGGADRKFFSRTISPAGIGAVHLFVALQGFIANRQRCSVVSPRNYENTSSLALNVVSGPGLQILAGDLYGKKIRFSKSVDRPFMSYLKSFLRKAAVFPGNVIAPATRSKLPTPSHLLSLQSSQKNDTKGKQYLGKYCVRVIES
jgi:hypothetical protein